MWRIEHSKNSKALRGPESVWIIRCSYHLLLERVNSSHCSHLPLSLNGITEIRCDSRQFQTVTTLLLSCYPQYELFEGRCSSAKHVMHVQAMQNYENLGSPATDVLWYAKKLARSISKLLTYHAMTLPFAMLQLHACAWKAQMHCQNPKKQHQHQQECCCSSPNNPHDRLQCNRSSSSKQQAKGHLPAKSPSRPDQQLCVTCSCQLVAQ